MNSEEKINILAYVKENGFGGFKLDTARPRLSCSLSLEEFRLNYYEKRELAEFCRTEGIATSGSKADLNQRIEKYLSTGEISKISDKHATTEPDSRSGLLLDKPVVNYKSDPQTRAFFQKHIPEFKGFSALVQKDLKRKLADGEKLTYRDLIQMHNEFLRFKQLNGVDRVAHDSCQFNQFQIDYKNDHNDDVKIHSVKEAWLLVRNTPGEKTFKRYKETIQSMRDNISK
jgi:hypothetical protein